MEALCCYDALQGYWDHACYPNGFEAMMSDCERVLELLGQPLPDYAARDAEWKKENAEDDAEEEGT